VFSTGGHAVRLKPKAATTSRPSGSRPRRLRVPPAGDVTRIDHAILMAAGEHGGLESRC
jgi:hypothetical protein